MGHAADQSIRDGFDGPLTPACLLLIPPAAGESAAVLSPAGMQRVSDPSWRQSQVVQGGGDGDPLPAPPLSQVWAIEAGFCSAA